MNIYHFIDSNAIREHCRKIGHIFTPVEQAYLVYGSQRHTQKEKHNALREIIDNTKDYKLPNRIKERNCIYEDFTFHEYLNALIEDDNTVYQKFLLKEENAVYMFFTQPECAENCHIFSEFDKCYEDALNMWREGCIEKIHITKMYFGRRGMIFSTFNDKQELLGIGYNSLDYDMEKEDMLAYFQSLWLNVPTPFKKGDVLYGPDKRIFILDKLCTEETEKLESLSKYGGLVEMDAGCYTPDRYGNLSYEYFFPYLDLDYCTDEEDVRRYKKLYDLGIKSMEG